VTVVRDKKEEGHAVLTVTTDRGDYVLDNQTADILLCSRTGYRFVKRNRSPISVCGSRTICGRRLPASR
jgi:predicted transglutaminase-like cysteine proteinase